MRLLHKNQDFLFPFCLILISIIVCASNYTPHTFLSGWDNLMPELNIWMNLKRSFFAAWQQYQGLGLNGGMGHAADIIRQLFLLPFTYILPSSLIRYFFHFLMIIIGPLGLYHGLKNSLKLSPSISFISAIYYLLSFGAIQNFWAPFEPFSTFYGFFPWLLFSLLNTLHQPHRQNLKKFFILNILATPSFYVPTVFIVYLLCLSVICIAFFIYQKKYQPILKTLGIIFLINSFWLLPFLNFTRQDTYNPKNGVGNILASEETYLRNQRHGNLFDFLLLRGYYYDLPDTDGNFMQIWQNYFHNPFIKIILLISPIIIIFGLYSLIKNRLHHKYISFILIGLFLLSCIALLSTTSPFSWINYLLRQLPLVNQIFRSPFTKFITPTITIFAILLGFGIDYLNKIIKNKYLVTFLTFISIIICSLPVFKGNYIYPNMRQKIDKSYFQLINYFKYQPSTARIMNLPSGSFWGWTNYRSGMRGSGFVWYGIEQPILDRAFDVWNLKNEQYYWELSHAIQKNDPILFENILKKYNVSYILFDNNIFFPDDKISSKNSSQTIDLFSQIPSITKEQQFGNISIYKYQNSSSDTALITNPQDTSTTQFSYYDPAFQKYQHYISNKSISSFPLTGLFTKRTELSPNLHITINENQLNIQNYSNNYSGTIEKIGSYRPEKQEYLRHTSDDKFFVQYFPVSFEQSYLLQIKYRHNSGFPAAISIYDSFHNFNFFKGQLSKNKSWTDAWFIIPKMDEYPSSTGLEVLINNQEFNNQISSTDIKEINLYSFPFEYLVNQEYPQSDHSVSSIISINSKYQSLIWLRKTNVTDTSNNQILTLFQSYHPNWLAFYFDKFQIKILPHTLVDNWANGWTLPSDKSLTIYILFWPQLLEFFGFILLPLAYFWVHKTRHQDHFQERS